MTTSQLIQQLASLNDTLKQTNSLISRLAKLSFQPGSEPLEGASSVRVELAQDIHDSLKQLEEDLELLTQDAEDLNSSRQAHRAKDSERDLEKSRFNAQIARLAEDLRQSRNQFRRAQLTAKRASEAAKQKEKELLFASLQQQVASDPPSANSSTTDLFAHRGLRKPQQKQLSKDEVLVHASSDVTAALRRTHDLLSTELSRSRFAQETFDQSTAALAELGEHYSNLDTVLSKSRDLLGTLLRSQKSDTWYLETAFYILIATLCWLFFRRILFGPFVKLPLFLWKVSAFFVNWLVFKPFFLFLSTTGILRSEPVGVSRSSGITSSSRPPLITHRSATAGAPAFTGIMADGLPKGAGVPAGAGGAGAKMGRDGMRLKGETSEQIAQMAEQSQRQAQGQAEEKELPRRGDGTVLQERGDTPRNPKKNTFEADVEEGNHNARNKRDEL